MMAEMVLGCEVDHIEKSETYLTTLQSCWYRVAFIFRLIIIDEDMK